MKFLSCTVLWAFLRPMKTATAKFSSCPDADILIGGSSEEQPLIAKWVEGYRKECTNTNLIVDETPCSSSCGARRVCSDTETSEGEMPLDVGTLSRPWRDMEAFTNNGYYFECVESNKKILSLNTAIFALTFAVGTGGVAHDCIRILGGLTLDQLRWIYSDNSRDQLIESGWDSDSVKNDDLDDNTHLWSELDHRCAETEILISGGTFGSADHQFVAQELFGDRWDKEGLEGIPINNPRPTGNNTVMQYFTSRPNSLENFETSSFVEANPHDLVQYLVDKSEAITFMKYPFAAEYSEMITMVAIKNHRGDYIVPNPEYIISQDYHPFSRYLHVNMVYNERILKPMKGFFEFVFSARGKELTHELGYFPMMNWEERVMLTLLDVDHEDVWGDFDCSSNISTSLHVAGSLNGYPVAKVWSDVYRANCIVDVKVEGGESVDGALGVCGRAIDVGIMSREFYDSEAVTVNGYKYECLQTGSPVIQIETAVEVLAIVAQANSTAYNCIRHMGGLTVSQLRWIYSSLTEDELLKDGWALANIPNSDGDPNTHLWSELLDHPDCQPVEIRISGPADDSTWIQFFIDYVLPKYGDGEAFADYRIHSFYQSEQEEDLVQYLVDHDEAISFLSYSKYVENIDKLRAAKIHNGVDEYVEPLPVSVQDGSYRFARRIYMGVLDTTKALAASLPYIELGLSDIGTELVQYTGYVPIPASERLVMQSRLQTSSGFAMTSNLECGPAEEFVSMAGSTRNFNLAKLLGEIYEIGCDVVVKVEGGNSAKGADRVCGGGFAPVDIGLMSRDWRDFEGVRNGTNVQCIRDTTRSTIQIPIASTAIALATRVGGVAEACIKILGGLTKDQLRWMFSSYDEKELEATGWNPSSLGYPDFDSSTHLWSELHSDCASTEILLGGPNDLMDVYHDLIHEIFNDYDNGETIATDNRPHAYSMGASDSSAVSFLLEKGAGIAFFDMSYYKRNTVTEHLTPVPIQNSTGVMVIPTDQTIQDGSYDFLAKPLYFNLNNDVDSLQSTVPLVRFGLSDDGVTLVESLGYVPLSEERRQQLLATLCDTEGTPKSVTCRTDTANNNDVPEESSGTTDSTDVPEESGGTESNDMLEESGGTSTEMPESGGTSNDIPQSSGTNDNAPESSGTMSTDVQESGESTNNGVPSGGIAGIVISVALVLLGVVATAVILKEYYITRKVVDTGDAKTMSTSSNPYAQSRINWATQEASVEEPMEELGPPCEFSNNENSDNRHDKDETKFEPVIV